MNLEFVAIKVLYNAVQSYLFFFTIYIASSYYLYLSGELNQIGDKILVARGGVGGSPNNQYNGQKGQVSLKEILVAITYVLDETGLTFT